MELIKLSHSQDWGHDWYLQTLFTKQWALFQVCVAWCNYNTWIYAEINSGMPGLVSILFQVHKFGLMISLFGSTWEL